jgi:Mn2+/Fe2+ NRAMP family transporter
MATGTTLLEGWVTKLGRWIQWVFLGYLLLFSLVTSGMLSSACGLAGAALVPLGDAQFSRLAWAAVHAIAGAALVWFGGYSLLKKVLAVCVGAMFATVTLTAYLLAPDWAAVGRGLIPSLPPGSAGWTVGLIGAIGGTMALISYGYWIREEGRLGKPGLRECRFDLLLSYTVIGVFGAAVVIIGSRVQVRGQGAGLALLLADQLAASLGPSGRWIFLIGFWAAVFSALLGVWQSLPYLFTDFLWLRKGAGVGSRANLSVERSHSYRFYLVCLATAPLILVRWPVQQLQLAFGLTGAMLLPLLALTLLLMNNREKWVGTLRNTLGLNMVLAASLLFFLLVGVREILHLLR